MKFLLLTFLCSFIYFIKDAPRLEKYSAPQKNDSTVTIKLSFTGDLMCHMPQIEYAEVTKDSFNFSPSFRYVANYLSNSDFTIGNLETVLAGESLNYSGYPFFNSPNAFADAVKFAGFDLLTTSNNHSLDGGAEGVKRTIKQLVSRNLNYTGTAQNSDDRDSIRIFNINDVVISFLAYSYGTNDNPIPEGKSYLINLIDEGLIKKDIEQAKAKHSDVIVVYFHFGEEYKTEPNDFQIDLVKKTIEYGADIIIGSHPHVLQPIQFYRSEVSKLDSVLVAYSLGNFISNQRKRYTDAGGVLNLYLQKHLFDGKIEMIKVEFIPTWVFKGVVDSKRQFIVLPSIAAVDDSSINFLSKNDLERIKISIEDTRDILTKHYKNISFN